jgi:hypothetical protein
VKPRLPALLSNDRLKLIPLRLGKPNFHANIIGKER